MGTPDQSGQGGKEAETFSITHTQKKCKQFNVIVFPKKENHSNQT